MKKLFLKNIYFSFQLIWWIFSTFYLRYPYTKYFQASHKLVLYLALNFFIGLGLTHIYAIFFRKDKQKYLTFSVPFIGAILVALAFYCLDWSFGFMRYGKPNSGQVLNYADYLQFYIESLRYIGIWFLFYQLNLYVRLNNTREIELAQSETALKSAQLENLKNQLNPHFLFNSLNSIKSLTLTDPQKARGALNGLSTLLRSSLEAGSMQLIKLEEELKIVKEYLALEKIRYEYRLEYLFQVDVSLLPLKIPPMSLQLLVENSIKYGILKNKFGGQIVVKAFTEEEVIFLSVENTGKLHTKSDIGLGLLNLERRLALNFQENASFILFEKEGKVIAEIRIKKQLAVNN
jgi:two-component system, LytTR family, sensor kinase